MKPPEPGLLSLLRSSGGSAPFTPAEPAKPAEPGIAIPAGKQEEIRRALETAGVPNDQAELFIQEIPELLGQAESPDESYQSTRRGISTLHSSKSAQRRLQGVEQALDAALEDLAAVEPVPPMEAPQMEEAIAAIQRARVLLRGIQARIEKVGMRPGGPPDLYRPLVLLMLAHRFGALDFPLVMTPGGLFAEVARILLKAGDHEVSQRDLGKAMRAARK